MKRNQQSAVLTKAPAMRRLTTALVTALAGAGVIAFVARLRR